MKPRYHIVLLIFCMLVQLTAMGAAPTLKWKVGYSEYKDVPPLKYVSAVVPGAVQLDIARSENYPSYLVSDNYKRYGWMEDLYYTYQTRFQRPDMAPDERLWFVSKGIDYEFEILLNGLRIHKQEGMFTPVALDLTDKLTDGDNELRILIYPVPKRHASPQDRTQASSVVKPAVSYQWDWHPRLIPLGIWDETGLEIRHESHVDDVYVNYTLNEELTCAEIMLEVQACHSGGKSFRWRLKDAAGRVAATASGLMHDRLIRPGITLEQPQLWWTHDHGSPYLYTSIFEMFDNDGKMLQRVSDKVGFRRVRLVMNEGAWEEHPESPKSRSVPPAQVELNGRRIFAKGSNWVNPEIFPGIITDERYERLVSMGVKANMNMFRVWGGGIVNKERFFEVCDSLGMLVWEEFPLACNNYPDDPHYLSVLKQEASSIVKRLRKHPCLGLWCGGNELFNSWSGMTDQSLALRLLNAVCLDLDPHTPYNPTSPIMGMGHGYYLFRTPDGKEVYELMNNAHCTAYTEFGVPGMSPMEVLKQIIPLEYLSTPKAGTPWEDHHAFNAWVGDTWLAPDILEHYFGKASSLEELIEQSQLLQSEGYKAIFEEARRQKPYCSMALNWCYNEPWPAAANNSLIVYPDIPKPAYDAVAGSCRPICASVRFSRFEWKQGEPFFAQVWILNDRYATSHIGTVHLYVEIDGKRTELLSWKPETLNPNENIAGPEGRMILPSMKNRRFKVIAQVENMPELDNEYTLLSLPSDEPDAVSTPVLNK